MLPGTFNVGLHEVVIFLKLKWRRADRVLSAGLNISTMIKARDLVRGPKSSKTIEREKKKAELAVCRIRKLPKGGKDYRTVGSGSLIRNDKCCLVTTDNVLPDDEDFDVKDFVLDFRKLNGTLKEFNLTNYTHNPVRRFTSGLVVIPLDPKGFETVKKPSIFTYRPLTWEDAGYSGNLVCPTVDDIDAKHFAVKDFRLEQMKDQGEIKYVLYDEHSSVSFSTLAGFIGTSSRKPHGAVVLSDKECKAVGVLYFPHDEPSRISPIWLSQEHLKLSSVRLPDAVVERPLVESRKSHSKEQPPHNEEVEGTSGTDEEDARTLSEKSPKQSRSISESTSDPDYNALLQRIQCAAKQGFGNLKRECTLIKVPSLAEDVAKGIVFPNKVDSISEQLMPVSKASRYVPLKVTGDGNCLFRAASILAFGHEKQHEEMRVRTVIELAVNSEFYLKDKDIMGRIEAQERALHPGSTRKISEIDPELVKTVFENDVVKTADPSSWASFWHLQALGAVLNRVVLSVYPECGAVKVRKYFDATIWPRRCDKDEAPLAIMWTHTTGSDASNFTPNHFVPLIPVDRMTPFSTEGSKKRGIENTEDIKEVKSEYFESRMEQGKLKNKQEQENDMDKGSKRSGVDNTKEIINNQVKGEYFESRMEQGKLKNKLEQERDIDNVKKGIQEMDLTGKKVHELDARRNQVTSVRLSTKVSDIPFAIYSEVCLKLNIRDEVFFKDFRLLGQKLGYSRDVTSNLGQRSLKANPTDELLRLWCGSNPQATVEKLIELLKNPDFKRMDVVEILEECPHMSTKVTDIPVTTYSKVCLKLNIRDDMFYKDFRLLGQKLGYPRDVTRNLEQSSSRPNPTDELLQMWCTDSGRQATVGRLIEFLKESDLHRMDVVEILEDCVSG